MILMLLINKTYPFYILSHDLAFISRTTSPTLLFFLTVLLRIHPAAHPSIHFLLQLQLLPHAGQSLVLELHLSVVIILLLLGESLLLLDLLIVGSLHRQHDRREIRDELR